MFLITRGPSSAKHCIELPDDGSLVIRNMLEQF